MRDLEGVGRQVLDSRAARLADSPRRRHAGACHAATPAHAAHVPCLRTNAAIPGSPPSAAVREWTDPAFTCEVLNAFPAKAVADVEEARVS